MKNLEVLQLSPDDVRETINEETAEPANPLKPFNPRKYSRLTNDTTVTLNQVKGEYLARVGSRYQAEIIIWIAVLLITGVLFFTHLDNPLLAGIFVLSITLLIAYIFFTGKIRLWRKAQFTKLTEAAEKHCDVVLHEKFRQWLKDRYGLVQPADEEPILFNENTGRFVLRSEDGEVSYQHVQALLPAPEEEIVIHVAGSKEEAPVIVKAFQE